MNLKVTIRKETDTDVAAITEVTVAAFKSLEISNNTEQFSIVALRTTGALSITHSRIGWACDYTFYLFASDNYGWHTKLVWSGSCFSVAGAPMTGYWQSSDKEGLSRLKDMNARGCCLVGHSDYYRKFRFRNLSELECERVPQEVFFALSLDGYMPQGLVSFHEAFSVNG